MAEYIEREAAIKAFDNVDPDVMADYGPEYGSEWGFSRDAIREVIGSLPTADVAPVVHGRFRIKRGNYITGGGNPLWCCSNCGQIFGASLMPPKDNYCPSCGAKMEEA